MTAEQAHECICLDCLGDGCDPDCVYCNKRPFSEPQAAPPEPHIWRGPPKGVWLTEYFVKGPPNEPVEYVLASTASALAEALRGIVCRRCENRIGYNGPTTEYGDWRSCSLCTAARTALARWEGKGGS